MLARDATQTNAQHSPSVSCAASTDFPQTWTFFVWTQTGVPICIRPLRLDDRDREVAFINSLSERSRYFRLWTPLKFLSPHLLDKLMDVDYHHRMAFAAVLQRDGMEEFVGIARYGETDQPGTAELGITVTDAWQRCGIARLLFARLMRFAYCQGIRRFTGIVLPDNAPMLGLARALGFEIHFDAVQRLFTISRDLVACEEACLPTMSRVVQTRGGCGELRVSGADERS